MSRVLSPRNIEVVDRRIADILASKSVAERVHMIGDANDTARLMATAGIRHCHPSWSEDEIQREVARRMLGAAD
jgi:hypothetical protein